MSRTENRPGGINKRAKGKRTDSQMNPGSFAAYLADAPPTAAFSDVVEAYDSGIDAADLHEVIGRGDS